jgi:hypothetical protein
LLDQVEKKDVFVDPQVFDINPKSSLWGKELLVATLRAWSLQELVSMYFVATSDTKRFQKQLGPSMDLSVLLDRSS